MVKRLTRHSIVKKTVQLGFSTMISKGLTLIREALVARYIGVGAIGDVFFSAFRIPSSLRKIFAEGAFSAACVPTFVHQLRAGGKEQVSRTATVLMFFLEIFLLIGCVMVAFNAGRVMMLVVPGWSCGDSERCLLAASLLRVLMFNLALVSAGALLASVLQAAHFFSLPVITQIAVNLLLCGALGICSYWNLPIQVYAWAIIATSILVLGLNFVIFWRAGFCFLMPNKEAFTSMWHILVKFVPCAIGLGAIEINLFIDQAIASYLPVGSVSLLRYTYAFTRVPLSVFATAFSAILFPHFSRVFSYAPRRLSFYLLEATKLIWWVSFPATVLMIAFSQKIYYTIFYSAKFSLENVHEAGVLLAIFVSALFFFSCEKIVLNMFYTFHETMLPTLATFMGALVNTMLSLLFIPLFGLRGIVLATVIAAVLKLGILLFALVRRYDFVLYPRAFVGFLYRTLVQFALVGWGLYILYNACHYVLSRLPGNLPHLLLNTFCFWLWVGPLCLVAAVVVYTTRRRFGIRMHFLD